MIYVSTNNLTNIIKYLEPNLPLFWLERTFFWRQNKGHLGSRYIYIYIEYLIRNFSSWWFQPISKILYSQIGSFPQVGMKIKNMWNHHLACFGVSRYIIWISMSLWQISAGLSKAMGKMSCSEGVFQQGENPTENTSREAKCHHFCWKLY